MADASQAPATKADIAMMMDEFGKLYQATEDWKDEILEHMQEWKAEIIHEFHIVKEDIRHDALGANKDQIQNHENRLKRVESHLQLSAL